MPVRLGAGLQQGFDQLGILGHHQRCDLPDRVIYIGVGALVDQVECDLLVSFERCLPERGDVESPLVVDVCTLSEQGFNPVQLSLSRRGDQLLVPVHVLVGQQYRGAC